jgi:hypothetical protein
MLIYTNDELRLIVKKKLLEAENKKFRLRIIANIALLFRKFHNATAERYKNEKITYIFDKDHAISQLMQCDFKDRSDLIYLTRKFEISLEELIKIPSYLDLTNIIKRVKNQSIQQNDLYSLILVIKYLCRNSKNDFSKFINPNDILDLIKISNADAVNNQLVWILSFTIKNLNKKISNDLSFKINGSIVNSNKIDESPKVFLLSVIDSNKSKIKFLDFLKLNLNL